MAALVVYRLTLLPGLGIWDTAEAQTVLPLMGTMHPTGFPAYVVLGWLASILLEPFGSPAFRINLLSAVLVSVSIAALMVTLRRLGIGLIVSTGVAAGFALTPIVWRIALAADVHALHLALLGVLVVCLLRWSALVDEWRAHPDRRRRARADRALVLAAAVFGVALANHALTLLLAPAVGWYVLAVERDATRRRRLVAAALGACLGVAALLYLELPLRAGPFPAPLVYGHPETPVGFLEVILARQFQGGTVGLLFDPVGRLGSLVSLALEQLGPLAVLVPVGLAVTIVRHPRYARLSGLAAGLTCLFAASYDNADIGRYYLGPAFFAWSWLAILAAELEGLVAARLARRPGRATSGSRPGPVRRRRQAAVALVMLAALLVPTAAGLQDRWQRIDASRVTWPSTWLDEALTVIEPNAVVVSWWSYSTPLWYGTLVDGRRPDLLIVDDRTRVDDQLGSVADVIEANLDTRPVYVIRSQASDLQALEAQFALVPVEGPATLYRVTGRQETQR
jgi:Protein O-mannosyl-transferase TMEM260-like